MEASNQFQLESAIDGYLQQLQQGGNYTVDDVLELKNHLEENVEALKQNQLSDEEAFIIAKKRLGTENELHTEYKKVNGPVFYNRDLFVMVFSICIYLVFSYVYSITKSGLQSYAVYGAKSVFIWGVISYVLQFAIVGAFIFLLFNNKRFISGVSRLFSKSPANFSSLLIILVVILYFADLYFQRNTMRGLSAEVIRDRYYQFDINNNFSNFVKIVLGSTVLIAFLAAFVTSYKKVSFLPNIINRAGYIALFCFGFFWDGLAASARMLQGFFDNKVIIASAGFGFIWFIGMFLFNYFLKNDILKRNLVFISFGFVMELMAGMFLNPKLRYGLPVSVFFLALVIGGGLGYLLANLIKKRRALAKST